MVVHPASARKRRASALRRARDAEDRAALALGGLEPSLPGVAHQAIHERDVRAADELAVVLGK